MILVSPGPDWLRYFWDMGPGRFCVRAIYLKHVNPITLPNEKDHESSGVPRIRSPPYN